MSAKRLKKLLAVQEKLKALHETRHAMHLAAAVSAERDAAEIAARADRGDSLASLFPDIYSRGVANALTRAGIGRALAEEELKRVATATARTNLVERDYRDTLRQEERERSDRERLEGLMVRRGPG